MGSFNENELKTLYQKYLKKRNKQVDKVVVEEDDSHQIVALESAYSTSSIYDDVTAYIPTVKNVFDE